MNIKIKKKGHLIFNKMKIRCCVGKSGTKVNKKEGDGATPRGKFSLGKLYYRKDRIKKLTTHLKKNIIKKNIGWCHNSNHRNYNRQMNYSSIASTEKLYRKDHKYDLILVINYNSNPIIKGKGSAIFLHITKNYNPTAGCVAINMKDFLKILKFIKKTTKIIIY